MYHTFVTEVQYRYRHLRMKGRHVFTCIFTGCTYRMVTAYGMLQFCVQMDGGEWGGGGGVEIVPPYTHE